MQKNFHYSPVKVEKAKEQNSINHSVRGRIIDSVFSS